MQALQNSTNSKKIIRISTDRYLIRSIEVDDVSDRWASWFSDAHVMYMLNSPSTNWNKTTVIKYIKQFDQISNLLLGIFEKQSNTLVGIFTVRINHQTRQDLITLLIGEADYRNKGVLTDVRVPFYDYMFNTLGLKMLLASALARNNIVVETMLKRGWKLDQTLKNHSKSNSDGTMLDLCLFSLSRDSWLAWKKANPAQAS